MLFNDEATQQNLLREWSGPAPKEAPSFNLWSFGRAGFSGPVGAVLESTGGAMDVLGAAERQTARAARPPVLAGQPQDRLDADRAAAAVNAGGRPLRERADELAPNPETAHIADQVIYGLTRGVTKAGLYLAGAGPVAPALFGLDEGNTTYQRLKDKGIPEDVAANVGATTGITSALGLLIPMGGKTIPETLALALTGGPGMFIAQEALAKDILQQAKLPEEAGKHDPFDPLGLALSIAPPAAAAGFHIRSLAKVVEHIESGGKRYGADGALLTSPKGAQGEMQVMPGTAGDPGFGVAPAKDGSPGELARVGRDYLAAMLSRYGDDDKALAAYNAGPGAVDRAVAAHGADWLAHLPEETQQYVAKANRLMGEHVVAKAAADPDAVAAARVKVSEDRLAETLPDAPAAREAMFRAVDEIGAGRQPVVEPVATTALPQFREWFGNSKVVDEKGNPLVVYHGTNADVPAFDMARAGSFGEKFGDAAFFSNSPTVAGGYAARWSGNAEFTAAAAAETAAIHRWGLAALKHGKNGAETVAARAEVDRLGDIRRGLADSIEKMAAPSEGANVVPVHLRLENPLEVDAGGQFWFKVHEAAFRQAEAGGHDGVIIRNVVDAANTASRGASDVYVAFDPRQVKSAIGNSGKFDPNSASLTDPLRPGERSPRDPGANTLPPPDAVTAETGSGAAPEPAKPAGEPGVDSERLKTLQAEAADMRVTLPGHDKPMRLEDALEAAKQEADLIKSDAELVRVAALCALSEGAI